MVREMRGSRRVTPIQSWLNHTFAQALRWRVIAAAWLALYRGRKRACPPSGLPHAVCSPQLHCHRLRSRCPCGLRGGTGRHGAGSSWPARVWRARPRRATSRGLCGPHLCHARAGLCVAAPWPPWLGMAPPTPGLASRLALNAWLQNGAMGWVGDLTFRRAVVRLP